MSAGACAGPRVPPLVQVAVPAPVRSAFDYLAPGDVPVRGARVRVPFGRGTRVGVCLGGVEATGVAPERLRPVGEVLDVEPLLPAGLLELLEWTASYYHHPVGEVVAAALPALLRRGRAAVAGGEPRWALTPEGRSAPAGALVRAPRQAAVLEMLRAAPRGLSGAELAARAGNAWQSALRALRARGWVGPEAVRRSWPEPEPAEPGPPLNTSQAAAVAEVVAAAGGFGAYLLEGVTGSGKTEVYLHLIEDAVRRGRQALVLVPEIGLTPQTVARFRRRLGGGVGVLHSALGEQERVAVWLAARAGELAVLVGTRSAVFVPLARPGVVIVDEEHDPSYKQQEGLRYSARDLAIVRARREGVPVLLGSATPSLESLQNAEAGRYRRLVLPERAGGAADPRLVLVDLRRRPLRHGLSEPLLEALAACLARGDQALLFLNRRGYAPVLICHACGWAATCQRCDAHVTWHRRAARLRCHHCGDERPAPSACPACGQAELRPVGAGTERLEEALADAFPGARVARLDRDSTRRRGALEAVLARVGTGEADVLIGTQMVAKGHHFPRVTLVGIVDADGGLFSADFRATEHLAQRILQVAGRAGRGERPGEVLVQTHHPEHPLLQALVVSGYAGFAAGALAERREAGLPPFAHAALMRAESRTPAGALAFLERAVALASSGLPEDLQMLGPVPAPMERRAGRYRAQLLLLAAGRPRLHAFLEDWLPRVEGLGPAGGVRWSLDVDPMEMG
jgi:primosomal protein N' (replication factor Y)